MSTNPGSRIIDRDVESYEAEIEECRRRLASCEPAREAYWSARCAAATKVYSALRDYQALINRGKAHCAWTTA